MLTEGRPLAGLTNWAGNHAYEARRLYEPASLDELQEVVRGAATLHVLGSRHSFNDVADTRGDLVSLDRMPRIFELDRDALTLRVDGAVRYGELCGPLHDAGFALHNLASLPHISVAGACATATHGSGDRSGNLATAVSSIEYVAADGEPVIMTRDRDPGTFPGVVVSLGALGVVTSLTLDVEPTFEMRQDVYEDLPLACLAERFDEITSSADSVSLFTEWRGPLFEQVWLKRRVTADTVLEAPPERCGATGATGPIHPIRRMSPAACTQQLGVPGPWHERLPHFRMDHTPSAGAELQSEYLIPRAHAVDALLAIERIRDRIAPWLLVSEVRTVAADTAWISTASGRSSVAIHFTWQPDWAGVRPVLPLIERALDPFEPRPHWGKLFAMEPAAFRSTYEALPRFVDLVQRSDPSGTFRNAFLERNLLGG